MMSPTADTSAVDGSAGGTSPVGNLDRDEHLTVLFEGPDEDLLWKVARRIESGDLELPQLPSTSLAAMELANKPSVELREIVQLISNDPLLSSELLKAANSALYAGQEPAETLRDAVMRVGMRTLRSMIFSVSMRGVVLRSTGLTEYAEEVWRQAHVVAEIARAIAPVLREDPERAFLIGLLHDIGKVALLDVLRRELEGRSQVSPALVGRVFLEYHEKAGAAMARAWRLPEELASVAACHHRFAENTGHGRAACLATLAHRLDLHDSLRDDAGFRELERSPMMDFLELSPTARRAVIIHAREACRASRARAPRR